MDEDQTQLDRAEYLDYRKSLIALGNEQLATFDKTLILVSTGTIGLPLLITQGLFPERWPSNIGVLLWSWAFFGATIIFNLASHLSSWVDTRIELKHFDQDYIDGSPERPHRNIARKFTMIFNYASFSLFCGGIVILVVFASNAFSELSYDRETTSEQARLPSNQWSDLSESPETDAPPLPTIEANQPEIGAPEE